MSELIAGVISSRLDSLVYAAIEYWDENIRFHTQGTKIPESTPCASDPPAGSN